jgi:hypothetical protein
LLGLYVRARIPNALKMSGSADIYTPKRENKWEFPLVVLVWTA